ncbi:MAG: hypothetical protein ACTTJY_02515 [Hoylesella shahii]|uniref:hypothetical protein n=1 Tax=Hoylesella shahii TaxID=228603 RepID=UPI003F9F3C68
MPTTNLMPAGIALGGQLFRDTQRDFVIFINTIVELSEIMPKREVLYDEVVHQLCSQSHGAK